ncbi:MAG: hypothetical protein HFH06_01810 [Lachnospiraceae bacterium]|uniref:DUF6056 family protein n=1 Tax=Xylanibacter caecicola TaxID=2736294 RepID=UPI00258B375A|nr:DUF6056 family protein [Xylanibacter caecicola]MCI9674492.1 hypothetical protein [Lachnospiraceae bacterium]
MKEKSRKIMWITTGILILISAAVMYVTHRAVPFMMDDLWYSTMLSDETPITSFADIITSQIWHYNNWGGRSMTHGILQITLLLGEHAADILNVVMTLLLSFVICVMARNRTLPAFWAAMAMLLGLNANFKMSMFWQAGAANYLYITVFILIFAWCYLRELPESGVLVPGKRTPEPERKPLGKDEAVPAPKHLWGITLWIIPLGILAGWSNENMGPAVWLLSLAVILLSVKEKRRLFPWMVLGNISCLAGSILVVAAPGNFVRSGQVDSNDYGFLWKCFLRGYAESAAIEVHLFPTLLVLGFMALICKGILRQPLGRRNVLLLLSALLSWGAMILSPHYPDRATFGTMALLICVIISLAKKIVSVRKDLSWMLWGITLLIWLRGMYYCGEFLGITWGWIK